MNHCEGCSGCAGAAGCGQSGCGGCAAVPGRLSAGERRLLEEFGMLAFLPLVRERESGALSLPDTALGEGPGRALLSLLLRRGLISVDPALPLSGFDYSAWPAQRYEHGSAALTLRGQQALDDLEFEES